MSTLVHCRRLGDNWQLFCSVCSLPLDIVSSVELFAISREYAPVLCLNCDGGADEIPFVLLGDVLPYTLTIAGSPLLVDPYSEIEQSRAEESHLAMVGEFFKRIMSRGGQDA